MKQEFLSLDYAADSDSITQSNEEVMSIHENKIRGVKSFMTFLFYILLHFTINIDVNISIDICCTLASWSNFFTPVCLAAITPPPLLSLFSNPLPCGTTLPGYRLFIPFPLCWKLANDGGKYAF